MMQTAVAFTGAAVIKVDLRPPDTETLPGVSRGAVEAFPTPAYWTYQVIARRICGTPVRYRLGRNLAEEVAACLLGGHGIPAAVGVSATGSACHFCSHRTGLASGLEGIWRHPRVRARLAFK